MSDAVPQVDDAGPLRPRPRRRVGSALVAGAMLGIRDVLEPPKDDKVVTWQASDEPGDVDADGIDVPVADGVRASAPALPALPERRPRSGRKRRHHR